MDKILIFAGTLEGRLLCEYLELKKIYATASVATQYGDQILEGMEYIKVLRGRLDKAQIVEVIKKLEITMVIDATHPYAKIVTENITEACEFLNIKYLRLKRKESQNQNAITFPDIDKAVEFLKSTQGNILVTTGSKELKKYTKIPGFEKRIFARVLPSLEVLSQCLEIGISGRNLSCIQGPFSREMNEAMLKDLECKFLVTKNTGEPGGFEEKVEAAKNVGAKLIVIDRPIDEEGYSLEEIKLLLIQEEEIKKQKYFPFFLKSENKNVLIIGGGNIGTRRLKTLLNFEFNITLVSPEIKSEKNLENITIIRRIFKEEDLENIDFAIIATENRDINKEITRLCKIKKIPCSVADKKEDGDFIFPGTIISKDHVIGITSDGKNPGSTKNMIEKIEKEIFGGIR